MDPFFDSLDCAVVLFKASGGRSRTRASGGSSTPPRLTITDMNVAAGTLLGVSCKDAAGRSLEDVFPPPAARALAAGISKQAPAGRSARSRRCGPFRCMLLTLGAGGYACLFTAHPAASRAGSSIITDLEAKERALSESEEKFRIISEQSQIGLCIVQDNRIVYANRAFSSFTGLLEGGAMKRSPGEEMGFNPGREMVTAMRRMAGGSQDAVRMADVPLTSILGERRWFNVLMKRISVNGKPAGMAALIDITEEKRAREQARERQTQLIQADKLASIGVLAAGVAHEINNPNQAIILSAQVLMDAWADMTQIMDGYREENGDFSLAGVSYTQMREMLANCISAIRDCSAKIETIVTDLKGFARQDASETFRPLDLNMAVRSSLTLLSNMLKKSTRKLTVELASHLPPVMGNYQRLEQVFINLIQNACQALPDPSRGIAIRTFFEERTSQVVFQVEDEGMGIKAEDMPHITDPFFTTKRESGGTGLGLSICATIVDQHGGRMEHQPRPEGGTRAEIHLPAA